MKNGDRLAEYIHAACGVALLRTYETERGLLYVEDIGSQMGWGVAFWTLDMGWVDYDPTDKAFKGNGITDPIECLSRLTAAGKGSDKKIYVLVDYHPFWKLPENIAIFKTAISKLRRMNRFLVILTHDIELPVELAKIIPVVDLPLPTREDLAVYLEEICMGCGKTTKKMVDTDPARLIIAAQGMTAVQAKNAFATMAVRHGGVLGEESVEEIGEEKAHAVQQSGLLEVIPHGDCGMDGVGGLDLLKTWLMERKRVFTDIDAAAAYGLPTPKGVLFVGVPGAGKSLTAKAVADYWGLPLLRFDPGRVFASLVGQSEERIREVCRLAEAMAPCVLWIDEVEKGLAGLQSSGVTDSGVTARVFGTLLTWMQEHDSPVMVVATANDIANLPAALIRRFDEVFRVDIPTLPERREILTIHITKPRRGHLGRKVEAFDLDILLGASVGLTGAEIEKAYLAALNRAFLDGREPCTEDFRLTLCEISPVTKTMEAQVAAMREWAKDHARPSSSPSEEEELIDTRPEFGFAAGVDTGKRKIHLGSDKAEKTEEKD